MSNEHKTEFGWPITALGFRMHNRDELFEYLKHKGAKSLSADLAFAFNKASLFSDLHFVCQNQTIYTHSFIVQSRCPWLISTNQSNTTK